MIERIPIESLYLLLASLLVLWVATFPFQFVLIVGDSMKPTIDSCSVGVYDKQLEYNEGEIVVFQNTDGETVTHRITSISGDKVTTQGDNNELPDIAVPRENVKGELLWYSASIGNFCSSAFQ